LDQKVFQLSERANLVDRIDPFISLEPPRWISVTFFIAMGRATSRE